MGGYNVPPPPNFGGVYVAPPKQRLIFVLLGVFLGMFGAHNFYAGYYGRGAAQAAITVCTIFTGSLISWIWALVEVCVVTRDRRNVPMI
jgi:TM2 domain-containing membrane protein YozV